MSDATPSLTPAEWNAISKTDLWSGPFGEPGHCHNLLDVWGDRIEQLEAALREVEYVATLTKRDDPCEALAALALVQRVARAVLDGEGTP